MDIESYDAPDAIEVILRGAGLCEHPDKYDSSIHGWRCEYPDRYGPCSCFQDLLAELRALFYKRVSEAVGLVDGGPKLMMDLDASMVCIAHGTFAPCRKEGTHAYRQSLPWVRAVLKYQSSADQEETWDEFVRTSVDNRL